MAAYAGVRNLVTEPTNAELLFCPFCRECYEGAATCPEHDLRLVPWDDLPRGSDDEIVDTQDLAPIDPRFGRAEMAAGALLLLVGFVCPLFTVSSADILSEPRTFSALAAAADQAPNLWTIPFVGVIALSLVLRRRSPRAMRGARLASLLLALAVPCSLAYTLYKVSMGAAQMTASRGYTFDVAIEWGVAVPVVAAVLLVIGSLRFGMVPFVVAGPASADPDATPDAEPSSAAVAAHKARRKRRR